MISEHEVATVVSSLKENYSKWVTVPRPENQQTARDLGMSSKAILHYICQHLSPQNYVDGPLKDTSQHGYSGDVWIFGLTIRDIECYLKVQRQTDWDCWISIHESKHSIHYFFVDSRRTEI